MTLERAIPLISRASGTTVNPFCTASASVSYTHLNETGKDDHINMFYQEAYCDDIAIDSEALLFNHSGETIWGDVANGKKRVGYVAYELPEGWQKFEFNYKVAGNQKMEFVVTPDSIA